MGTREETVKALLLRRGFGEIAAAHFASLETRSGSEAARQGFALLLYEVTTEADTQEHNRAVMQTVWESLREQKAA